MNASFSELDGKRLYYSFLAGAQKIFANYPSINRINVFPVADGDTGSNLASTLRSIVDSHIPTRNLKVTATALADAALVGARGNSGIIFAQFLYGFSNEIPSEQNLTVAGFAESIKNSIKYAYEAIANPVEGTMITVMREWAEYIYSIKDKFDDFYNLILDSYERAKQSLAETPFKLEVLARANVVDAGGKGFVVFLEGMLEFFKNGELKSLVSARNVMKAKDFDEVIHMEDQITYRYCTEALITCDRNLPASKTHLTEAIGHFGDSLVIAGSQVKCRIHIHTDQPAELFSVISRYGNIVYKKVDDMVMQNQVLNHRRFRTGILTDSTCDLPAEIIEKYQVQVIPLTVHFKDDYYLDNITITPDIFYRLLETGVNYPTTSQPTYKEFTNRYEFLTSHYTSIISLHISDKLSGTFSNSRKAAHAIVERNGRNISVFNSAKVACSLGLLVLRTAEEIEKGRPFGEVNAMIPSWIKDSHLFVSTKTLKYLVKGGRVSHMKGWIGKYLKIQPVLVVTQEGKAELLFKPRSLGQSIRMIIDAVKEVSKDRKIWGYAFSYAENREEVDEYVKLMEEITGQKPRFISPASPVLGVHTGKGVLGLGIMLE